MKKTKLMIIVLTAVFLAVSFNCAQAQGHLQDQPFQQQGDMMAGLGLTAEQKEKLEVNRKEQRQEFTKLMTAKKEKQERLENALKDPKATLATIQPLIAEIKSLQARMFDQRINGIFAVKKILTPEQFIKFQEKIEKSRKDRKGLFQERQKSGIGKRCFKG